MLLVCVQRIFNRLGDNTDVGFIQSHFSHHENRRVLELLLILGSSGGVVLFDV